VRKIRIKKTSKEKETKDKRKKKRKKRRKRKIIFYTSEFSLYNENMGRTKTYAEYGYTYEDRKESLFRYYIRNREKILRKKRNNYRLAKRSKANE
jgi:hypothetical protein